MARNTRPSLSRAETEVLALLWDLGRGSVQEVCDRLPLSRDIRYATVQTLLRRLEKKGYIGHDIEGKAHIFKPLAKRQDVIQASVSDFVDRLFGGDPIPLMLHLADHAKLGAADIKRLKGLISKDEG
ncbi:MAG: BlaI/MecI/CopY family transcriptional regulator [Myxococcales bacterium]